MNAKAPGRFKFILKNDYKFNWCIVVNVIYLNSKSVFYIIDEATAFQTVKFLKNISIKTT